MEIQSLVNKIGQDWVYIIGAFNLSNYLRYKVLNGRCYVEMRLEKISINQNDTQYINNGSFPKPYGDVYRIGINGINTNQSIIIHLNNNGGLLMSSNTPGIYYPVSAFDYEVSP